MKIAIGSDHAGLKLKSNIKIFLQEKGIDLIDVGTDSEESVDYPDFAEKLASLVISGEAQFGIGICGSGIGMAIAANKIPGIRAANCCDTTYARLSREHNDANVLTLGARFIETELAQKIVDVWLNTEFQGGRHLSRVEKIKKVEDKYCQKGTSYERDN